VPRHPLLSFLAALVVIAGLPCALAQKYSTADQVMDAVDARPVPADLVSTMTMTITAKSGQSLTRSMDIWSAGDGDRQVIKFTAPADIKGSGFLSITMPDGATQSMIYLPALDRTRRIAGSQKQEAFFGSDFSYEDISDLQSGTRKDYVSELLKVKPGPVYVVQSTPKAGAETSYQKLVLEIPEATLLPRRIEFYRNGALLKVMTIGETTKVGDYVLPSELRMETVARGSSTTIRQSDFAVDKAIPDEVFSERFLRR